MTRAQREAEARRLRNEGLLFREIAERMGVAISTVDTWLNDPGGHRLRARKDSYRGVCETCGGPTDGSGGPNQAPTLCLKCLTWTRERVLLAFTEWADEHGGVPPRCEDVRNSGALPYETTVSRLFGSWNEGLLAAGFDLRCDRRPETAEAILQAVRSGEPTASIAARFGVTPNAIHKRMKQRGTSVEEQRWLGSLEEQVAA